MVSSEVVMQTVRRMMSSGVDDGTIRSTLKGINLSDSDIDEVMDEAKGVVSKKGAPPQEALSDAEGEEASGEVSEADEEMDDFEEEPEEEPPEPDMKKGLDAVSQEQAAQHTTTHQYLEEHNEKMDEVKRNVEALHSKMDSSPRLSPETITKLESLDRRIISLEKEIKETKANTVALQSLLKKILETNKKTLLELQK